MNRSMLITTATTLRALALTTRASAETLPPGEVSFGEFFPPNSGGEYVEVNLGSSLISVAARLVPKDKQ